MPGHHFLSYSRFDAEDFALQLHNALEAGAPAFSVWLDKIDLKPGRIGTSRLPAPAAAGDSLSSDKPY